MINGSPGRENGRLPDTSPSTAPLRLDADALRLLEAMHRGCTVRLDDGDGLRWHVEPRIVLPMKLYGEDEITLVDLDSDEMNQGIVVGDRRHMPDWPLDQPYLRLGAGILLIRTSLAVRKGIVLLLTPLGRTLAAFRIGAGVDMAGRPVVIDEDAQVPAVVVSDAPIEMTPFSAIPAEQRMTVLAGDRGSVLLRFEAGDHRSEAILERRDVDPAFATLSRATDQRIRCMVDLSDTTRLLKGGRTVDIQIETMQDFDRAIASLRGSYVDAFITAVQRAFDQDVTTVLQPVAVAYGRFDAVVNADVALDDT